MNLYSSFIKQPDASLITIVLILDQAKSQPTLQNDVNLMASSKTITCYFNNDYIIHW